MDRIEEILSDLESWMQEHDFENIDHFRGKLSKGQSEKSELLERLQYIKALVGVE